MTAALTQMLSTLGGTTEADASLLARFRDARDEGAFAELVRRHGPLVLGVCRRALGNGPDAEDAFQACFLVLAKRIDTACVVANLAGWLYRVACLTARKARIRRARRRAAESAVAELPDVPAPSAERDPELGRVIDEELAKLPDVYRTAVVLCELRELTVDEAAAELGCPRGTVASRLARGRGMLGKRLLRRGLAGVGLSAGAATARVPAELSRRAIEAAVGEANGVAVQLSQEVLRAMSGINVKAWVTAAFVAAAVALGGLGRVGPETQAAPVPELKAKGPAAELDRVRLDKIGAALACPTIREQLKITAEQEKKLDAAWAAACADYQANLQKNVAGGAGPESALHVFNGMDDTIHAFDTAAAKLLSNTQLTRLRQIQLQRDGAAALLGRHAARVLKLTPEQEDKIAAEAAKARTTGAQMLNIELQAGMNPNAAPPQVQAVIDAVRRKQSEDFDGRMAAAAQHLTAEQKKAWADLTGEPIPSIELLRAATPFSDPKFGKLLTGGQQPAAPPADALPDLPLPMVVQPEKKEPENKK